MTLFQSFPAHPGLMPKPSAQHRLGEKPASPDDIPVVPPVSQTCRLLLDRLLPAAPERERSGLAAMLVDRLAERVVACRIAMIRTTLGRLSPRLSARLEDDPDGLQAVVAALAASLAPAAAMVLLRDDGMAPAALLSAPTVAAREAALDVLAEATALDALDLACRDLCRQRLVAAIDQLPLDHNERVELRRDMAALDLPAAKPVPQHHDADEVSLVAALQRGDHSAAILLLAAASLIPVESIQTAIALRSRRGLVSLAWKAGFSMRAAVLLQSELAGIAPERVLTAMADGSCPLSRNEMVWQIGFLARKLN